jgi:hypothetical protein
VFIYIYDVEGNKPDVLHLKELCRSCVHIQLYNVTLNTIDIHRSGFSSSEVLASLRGPLNVDKSVVQYVDRTVNTYQNGENYGLKNFITCTLHRKLLGY